QVLFVVLGQDDLEDAGAMRSQQLLLQAADGQYFAAKGDLTGHRDIAAHGNAAERAGDGGGHGDARGGAIFGDGAFGHVQVNVDIAVEVARQAKAWGARADVGERRLG